MSIFDCSIKERDAMAANFQFRKNLYLGRSMNARKLGRVKRYLVKRPLLANVHLIVPAANPADQLDILDARQLVQPCYAQASLQVLGIAGGYLEALELVETIVCECLRERGDCNLREFFAC